MTHPAFAHPDMSVRKMSMKTVMSSQIQMIQRKNHSIAQNTSSRGMSLLVVPRTFLG
jgi:hypothetical protein